MAPFFVSNHQVTTMRHFLIGFALVCAVGFGGEAFAAVVQFPAATTPTEALTKPKMIPKLSVGGTVVPLHRANKLNPWSAALSLGSAAAMVYFEDELNASLYELFMGDTPPPDPEGTTGGEPTPENGYVEGRYWRVWSEFDNGWANFNNWQTAVTHAAGTSNWTFCNFSYGGGIITGVTAAVAPGWCGGNSMYYENINSTACNGSTASYCQAPEGTPKQWPEDGKFTQWLDPLTGTVVTPEGETDTTATPPLGSFYQTEHGIGSVTVENGVMTISEWLEQLDANGNTETVHEWANVNAKTGEVIGTGQTTNSGSIKQVAAPAAPLEIPSDYARENTLGEIRDALQLSDSSTDPVLDLEIPAMPDPVTWDMTTEHSSFWSWLRGTFPFSLLTSPLAAISADTPSAPQFCYNAVGIEKCHSMSMWDPLFSAIRFAEGLLLIFGFYLVMVRAVMRFGG